MNCDVCKEKEANVFFTQIINGQVQKVNLCEECSKQKGVTDPTGYALAELLLGMGTESATAEEEKTEVTCARCGFSQADFKRVGRLGCAECYTIFREEVTALLKNIHKDVRHVGKMPPKVAASVAGSRLETLKRDLSKAITEEDFENAARLRDEINHLSEGAPPSEERAP